MSSSLMETGTTREGKPKMELMNCWRLRVDNFWELKIPGASRHKGVPTLLWVLLVAWPSSHSEYWRKLSLCFWQGEGKRNHTEMCQSILSILFSTRSVLKLARVLLLPNWHGVAESWTRLSDFTFTFHFHALEKEMATHSSVLAWRIPGMVEPGGLPSMGSHRVGHDWSDLAAAAALIWNLLSFSSLVSTCHLFRPRRVSHHLLDMAATPRH